MILTDLERNNYRPIAHPTSSISVQYHERLLVRWKDNLPDDYILKLCVDEEMIAEHCWTGKRVRWNGQFWQIVPDVPPSIKRSASNLGFYSRVRC